MTNLGSAVNNN